VARTTPSPPRDQGWGYYAADMSTDASDPAATATVPSIRPLTKVLVANRGEIAVRVIRACHDAGIGSLAVYADSDRDDLHVRLADEAYALDGATAGQTYLSVDKLLAVAAKAGADAVHPGYGFLAENAGFAQAVIDAGLIWIGPPPSAIDALGDKVKARHIAQRAGAPLVPGTTDPVGGADEVVAFAQQHGLPVAIKAAYGGGGRGLKVARTLEQIPELYDSAVREAVTAFGRGECFVERFLDHPRHVETQCLADAYGTVVVVSTRDCSLQRRNQKLVEEAPAPFLTQAQHDELYRASKAILRAAGYVGAGTCEFLVGPDGVISFLEVNTRLQVEHCVSEQVTGLDLVREQFRLAAGEALGYDDPEVRGHSIEFRINGEDPGRGFLPQPGTVRVWRPPTGPGVRLDSGFEQGSVIGGAFDSMLAKLVITGATRRQALERARRALAEFVVEGLPTVIPFHRAVVADPAFAPAHDAPFTVHTRWIETEFAGGLAPWTPSAEDLDAAAAAADGGAAGGPSSRQTVMVEVDGKRLQVSLPGDFAVAAASPSGHGSPLRAAPKRTRGKGAAAAASGDALTCPMQGTIVRIAVEDGQQVAAGDLVVVLEAMKMEQPLTAHKSGTVKGLSATVGQTLTHGAQICEITD
jgi:acetyl-CoA/propionyl-CoA carboxylase, biotin carboxylase, biotin carboxyl carrier protein